MSASPGGHSYKYPSCANARTLYATLFEIIKPIERMKVYAAFCFVTLLLISCTVQNSGKSNQDERSSILSLERKWLEAEFSLDTVYLASIMDSNYFSVSEKGIQNKQEDIHGMYVNIKQRNQDSIFIDSFKFENPIVNIYENSAVVTLIIHTFGKDKAASRERRTRVYDVWIRRNRKWKAVSSQVTALNM